MYATSHVLYDQRMHRYVAQAHPHNHGYAPQMRVDKYDHRLNVKMAAPYAQVHKRMPEHSHTCIQLHLDPLRNLSPLRCHAYENANHQGQHYRVLPQYLPAPKPYVNASDRL